MIDAKAQFNILADGSDETAKINAAFAAAGVAGEGEEVYFGPGIYGCNGLAQLTGVRNFRGAGIRKTTFKNLSATVRLFDFQPGTGPGATGSSFMRASDFSVDQNGCSGSAIRLNVQYNGLANVWVYNQGGGSGGDYAISMENATLADLENVHISNSDNCLAMVTCYYVNARNVSIERQKGKALAAVNCAQTHFTGLYLDNGNPSSVGANVPEIMLIIGCTSFHVSGLSAEIADAGTLTPNVPVAGEPNSRAYFLVKNSRNVNLSGVRVNHSAAALSSFIFYADGSGVTVAGVEWYESRAGMILFGTSPTNKRLAISHVDTYSTAPSSRYGVGMFYGAPGRVTLEDWTDWVGACTHYLMAADIYAQQVSGPIIISACTGRKTLFNCSGGVSGDTTGAHLVNC